MIVNNKDKLIKIIYYSITILFLLLFILLNFLPFVGWYFFIGLIEEGFYNKNLFFPNIYNSIFFVYFNKLISILFLISLVLPSILFFIKKIRLISKMKISIICFLVFMIIVLFLFV